MEVMPYKPTDAHSMATMNELPMVERHAAVTMTDWREKLPVLTARGVTLRELRAADAPSLCALLTTEEVSRFITPPPTTVEGFERFIAWTHREREAGRYVCFGIVPYGMDVAVGLFQVRSLEANFATAEWGFVMGSAYWGSGLFVEGAKAIADFAFETLGTHRLEARSSLGNGRGNGALRKLGAVREGILRRAFVRNGAYHDQNIWSILKTDWMTAKVIWEASAYRVA